MGCGLYLEVAPCRSPKTGGTRRRQKYRFLGKEKRLSHGTYQDVSLAEARAKRDAARKMLGPAGVDPNAHRKATRAASEDSAANSFEVLARELLAKQAWVESYG